ncbi:hypothetical protein PG997_006022 [Apiospora hydei]|uniref:Uncharacterized protein n=1 Tax=Apiospora hydei TaxID=1337664 RepID=A0ABR1WML1_9PEZI
MLSKILAWFVQQQRETGRTMTRWGGASPDEWYVMFRSAGGGRWWSLVVAWTAGRPGQAKAVSSLAVKRPFAHVARTPMPEAKAGSGTRLFVSGAFSASPLVAAGARSTADSRDCGATPRPSVQNAEESKSGRVTEWASSFCLGSWDPMLQDDQFQQACSQFEPVTFWSPVAVHRSFDVTYPAQQ